MDVITEHLKVDIVAVWQQQDWSQLWRVEDFRWEYGRTPFSHWVFPVAAVIVYNVVLQLTTSWMAKRHAIALVWPARVHNLILCLWSLAMFVGVNYYIYLGVQKRGTASWLLCETEPSPIHGGLYYWGYIYYLSKFYELLDTFIQVLRKRSLDFLHIYHHSVIVVLTWSWLHGGWTVLWWAAWINTLIHVLMYYYYFYSSFGGYVWWKRHITQMQIFQFWTVFIMIFVWLAVSVSFTPVFSSRCAGEMWTVLPSQLVNVSFLWLFFRFYKDTYVQKKREKDAADEKKRQAHLKQKAQ